MGARVTARLATSITAGIALILLYLVFLLRYYVLADWSALSDIELWIFSTMILRVVVLLILRRRFNLQPVVPILLFSIESLLIPPLLGLFLYTGNTAYALAMGTILTAWIGASAIVLTPYLIYDFARYMTSEVSLWGIFFLATLEYAFGLFMASLLSSSTTPITGLAGLGSLFVISLKSYAASTGVPFALGDATISAASLLFYASMLLFATAGGSPTEGKLRFQYVLLLPLIATVILFLWTSAALVYNSDIFIVLTAPTILLAVIIWGGARGRI